MYRETSKSGFAFGLLAAGILISSAPRVSAVEIVPATVHDIITALGPDANGLALSQDALPDLFTLTASRIDEDSKRFTIQQPYKSGRWKGGKVVIEYARDLSYTLVNVYDKEGQRQRIYSVSTEFTEHVEQLKAQNQEPPPAAPVAPPPSSVPAAAQEAGGQHSYEWNDAQSAYVPAAASAAAVEAVGVEKQKPVVVPSVAVAEAPAQSGEQAPPSQSQKRRHPREEIVLAKASEEPPPATKVQVGNATWVERRPAGPKETPPAQEPETNAVPVKKSEPAPVVTERVEPKPTPTPAPANPPTSASVAAVPPVPETAKSENVPTTEELLSTSNKKSRPDTSEGDAWVPKETPKPVVVEPVVPAQEPVKVAMIPKPAPVDNSVENILKIANEKKAKESHESDSWVPKKTKKPNLEVDIDREVERIRAQENKQAAQRKPSRIKLDVNNPEEGVLPVSSFEKFSGPMYGRHREYERHFVPGKNKLAKAPDHDFYVDEVDRKKEIHNIYFYAHQKGKGPRLVAVERHAKVSFRGNYDIEKEDSGKISTYN